MNEYEKNLLEKVNENEIVKKYQTVLDEANVPASKRVTIAFMLENQMKYGKSFSKEKSVVSEATSAADVATMDKNIMKMITRGMPAVIGTEIFGNQPLQADTGVFFYMQNFYTNDGANSVKPADSKVIIVASSTGFTVGGGISSTGDAGVGTVRIVEDNKLLVEIVSGSFANGDSLDNAASFTAEATTAVAVEESEVAKKIFRDYMKFSSIANAEAASTGMREIELGIGKETVEAEYHKLKMRYTWEVINRLRDYHGINGDAATDEAGAMAYALTLNARAMNDVNTWATAGGVTSFDYDAQDGRWELERYKNLLASINRRSADILSASKMGLGNYLIISPNVWASLDAHGYIDKAGLPGGMADPSRNPFVGILLGRYRVYVDIWETGDIVNMGYKDFAGAADSELRAGAFFCPYLPVSSIKTVGEDDGQPRKFFTSSFATKLHPFATKNGGNDFFRKISISNLPA